MVTAKAAIVVLTPPIFNLQPFSVLFETIGKKLAKTKILASVNVQKIKAKKIEKRLLKHLR
jgi:hypothetical protein